MTTFLRAALAAMTVALLFAAGCSKPDPQAAKPTGPGIITAPDWTKGAVIYEVNLRQYSQEGTFKAFDASLPRLREMGVDVLWFMPVHPIGKQNRKGGMGSYYSVQDYRAISPDYGTMDDFKATVKKAHEMGFKVIIDWVANHSAWDNATAQAHPDWYVHKADGTFESPFDWTDVIKFDYSKPEMRAWMIENLRFWVQECDIDGFRCDVAAEVPTDFWQAAAKDLQAWKHIFLLAEADKAELHTNAFHASYGWRLKDACNNIAAGKKKATELDSVLKFVETFKPGMMMNFTTNHDENSWNGTEFERLKGGAKTFSVLTFTLPGMPLVYSGQEAAFDHRLSFFEKDPIVWGNYSDAGFFTQLTKLKHGHPALASDASFTRIGTSKDDAVFGFIRRQGEDEVVVLANLTSKAQEVLVNSPAINGEFTDYFTQKPVYFNEAVMVRLQPWEYVVGVH
jgi:glycosidase